MRTVAIQAAMVMLASGCGATVGGDGLTGLGAEVCSETEGPEVSGDFTFVGACPAGYPQRMHNQPVCGDGLDALYNCIPNAEGTMHRFQIANCLACDPAGGDPRLGGSGSSDPECDGQNVALCEGGTTFRWCGDPERKCHECRADVAKCIACENGTCDAWENEVNCPADCPAGAGGGECTTDCPSDPVCGDGACNGTDTCGNCAADCGACEAAAYCGDGSCNGGEGCSSCAADCGVCPDTCVGGTTYQNDGPDCDPVAGTGGCSNGALGTCIYNEPVDGQYKNLQCQCHNGRPYWVEFCGDACPG